MKEPGNALIREYSVVLDQFRVAREIEEEAEESSSDDDSSDSSDDSDSSDSSDEEASPRVDDAAVAAPSDVVDAPPPAPTNVLPTIRTGLGGTTGKHVVVSQPPGKAPGKH